MVAAATPTDNITTGELASTTTTTNSLVMTAIAESHQHASSSSITSKTNSTETTVLSGDLPPTQTNPDHQHGHDHTHSTDSDANKQEKFILYRYRYLVALVTPSTAVFFNTDSFHINLISILFQAMLLPFTYVAIWQVDTYGLRWPTFIGAILTCSGALIRYLSVLTTTNKLAVLYTGQIIAGSGSAFVQVLTTKTAAHWFGENERLTANTIMALGQPIGAALILGSAPAITGSDPSQTNFLNLVTLILSVVMGLTALFVYNEPKTPASKAVQLEQLPLSVGLSRITRNKSFWLLLLAFGCIIGSFNTYITLISDLVKPSGYSEDDAGNLGIATIGVGIVSAGVECTYPVQEGTTTGLLWFMAQLFGIALLISANALRTSDGNVLNGMFLLIGALSIAAVCTSFYSSANRRMEAEHVGVESVKGEDVEMNSSK
ncbi:Major facilitator super domain-containing protein 7 [Blyttiomyces sp. JEL0837]|nr:Major facilitator super domain-containing protein 7 [Blyttiomyces sp. JEL0837]